MLKKHMVIMASVLCAFLSFAHYCEARPAWISISYSGFTLHRNPGQNDATKPGYYYAKIIATCQNNSTDKSVSSIVDRSMAFTANAHGNGMQLGEAAGSVRIDGAEAITSVGPGEVFKIEYSVPVLQFNGGDVAPFNSVPGARLNGYNLKHDFQVN